MTGIKKILWLCVAGLLLQLGTPAWAQNFPNKTITIIEPFPPGGIADSLFRISADKLRNSLGVNVLVDNKPGASGIVAMEYVLRQPADGYTLFGIPSSVPALWAVKKTEPFPLDKFKAVSNLVVQYNGIVASPRLNVKTGKELFDYIRAHPKVTYGTTGLGGFLHLGGEELSNIMGVPFTAVHYPGQAPVLTDLLGGHLDIFMGSFPNFYDPQLPVLAVSSPDVRMSFAPDVPTFKELGVNFTAVSFFGFVARAETPAEVLAKLEKAVVDFQNDPAVIAKIEGLSLTPQFGAENLARNIKTGYTSGKAVSDKINLKID